MNDIDTTVGVTILVSTLTILLFIGLVVLLLVVSHNRRNRHRAELAEVRARHAEEVRKVEQEVLAQTLSEVGRDLHDNIGQLLSVTSMGVSLILHHEPHNTRATEVKANLDAAISEVRRVSRELNVDRWDQLSLAQAMAGECDRVRRSSAVQVVLKEEGHEPLLTPDQKLVLFRIFQETMNNALKHAQARRIDVLLADGDGVRLQVTDDGVGFSSDAPRRPHASSLNKGQGLSNIRRRAALIGYHCEVTSQPGKGTTITVTAA